MNVPHATSAVSASERPSRVADRGIGSDRSRSNRPLSTSSATPTRAAPANSARRDGQAGIRKSA